MRHLDVLGGPRPPPRTSALTPEAGGPQGSDPLYGQRRSDRAMPEDELLGTPDESRLTVGAPRDHAAGVEAVAVAMGRALGEMGPSRATRTLLRLNQVDGFDCMSCAWPDPDPEHRHQAEFCENGAKAVAEEATKARVTPEFFTRHSIADLSTRTDYWLGKQGRLTHPMVRLPGATHYEPIGWHEAF